MLTDSAPAGPDEDITAIAGACHAALETAYRLGCSHAEVRVATVRTQYLALRDGRVETATDRLERGISVRVHRAGMAGFAASVVVGPQTAAALATQAARSAALLGGAGGRRRELAPEPGHGTVVWRSPHRRDPTGVPLVEKTALLADWSALLAKAPGVDHVDATLHAVGERTFYADLAGTTASQYRVRVHPEVQITAVGRSVDSPFESLRSLAPPAGLGWEYCEGEGWDFAGELAGMPELLAEKCRAPSVTPGRYDLVVDPTNLWLTIHESIGHATELDRVLGDEAAYAGTSFATLADAGTLRYGSPHVNVVADRTTPHGLATVALDDEGVTAQSFPLIEQGVLVGFQLDRAAAAEAGFARSNGCSYADSALHVPISRMANVSLRPAPGEGPTTQELIAGVEEGIYVVGDRSWSIDMQRYNFQFTAQRFHRISKGRLAGQLRDVAYQATTTEFWNAVDAVGGATDYLLCGALNCGKGQPGQVAPVSHGCPAVVARQVAVLSAKSEAGR